ncbi:hypothetical protein EV193_105363 [Herbihabitans rhizosphaerae]|uniref:Secretory lipase n=1 Tax=Herbihabitans rhizosphaerae TaxID=1872711 RepID=A0A4Q7KN62_9PSEU|nr:hypothetical protein [Herbihabitans rhizosphaerae]RZS37804.1 hypothetical protein EV193_105363 [Herbihabitans rhizosphaerae]
MNLKRRAVVGVAAVTCVATAVTAMLTATSAEATPGRGTLVSATVVDEIDAGGIHDYLRRFGIDSDRARYGVTGYRIEYRTVDAHGRRTTASGLTAVPRTGPGRPKLAAWLHGTQVYRGDVASMNDKSTDRAAAYLLAASGHVTAAPDYLGLGTGPGYHPYLHLDSEVTASVDALLATRELARRHGQNPERDVAVSGFSQGGSAAMALGRALQYGVQPRLGVRAISPVSGPYDVGGALRSGVTGEAANSTAYLGFLVTAWNRVHGLYDSPADAFRKPELAGLFDGFTPPQEIFPQLPKTPRDMFTPEFFAGLEQPTGTLRRALRDESDGCRWRPRVPTHVYFASGDRDVAPAQALTCAQQTDAVLTDVGQVDHNKSVKLALPMVVAEFDQLSGSSR